MHIKVYTDIYFILFKLFIDKSRILYYCLIMPRRMKDREYKFVTNEYFYKYGLSRQAVQYQIKKGDMKPFGKVKGMFLYYQPDADLMILNYWMNNFKKLQLSHNLEIEHMLFLNILEEHFSGFSAMGIAETSKSEIEEKSSQLRSRISAFKESGLGINDYQKKEKYLRAQGLSYEEINSHFEKKYKNRPIKKTKDTE